MTRWLFLMLIAISVALLCQSACKTTQKKGYVNADGIWVDTVHFTIRDTIVKHVKVKETFPDIPYYNLVKTNSFNYIPSLPSGWVNDYSHVLSAAHAKTLDSVIEAHYKVSKEQIAIVIVDTLRGRPIEDASRDLYQNWQLWKTPENKGVLLLISVKDRGTVIEVGSGHKAYFTMDVSRDIIRTEIIPEFRKGRYFEGINDGLNGILYVLNTH